MKKIIISFQLLALIVLIGLGTKGRAENTFSSVGLYGNYYIASDPSFNIWVGNLQGYGDVMGLYYWDWLFGYSFLTITNINWDDDTVVCIGSGPLYVMNDWGYYSYCCDLTLKHSPAIFWDGQIFAPEKYTIRLYDIYTNLIFESYLIPF